MGPFKLSNMKTWITVQATCLSLFSLLLSHYRHRTFDGSGRLWAIHAFRHPDLWPSARPNKRHRQGSPWCLHPGTLMSFWCFCHSQDFIQVSHDSAVCLNVFFSSAARPICGLQTWTDWGTLALYVCFALTSVHILFPNSVQDNKN